MRAIVRVNKPLRDICFRGLGRRPRDNGQLHFGRGQFEKDSVMSKFRKRPVIVDAEQFDGLLRSNWAMT